jgi:type I restriction enzyme M protein
MAKLSLAKLERHLYAAADILRREGVEAAVYKDYIFGLMFLKRASDVFETQYERIVAEKIATGLKRDDAISRFAENKNFYLDFFVPKRARWVHLLEQLNDTSVVYGSVLNQALTALSEANASLEHVFDQTSFMRMVATKRLVSDEACRELVRHFNKYRLRNEDFQFPDLLGAAYEFLINMFAESAGKKGGDFYTPRDVIRLMVRILKPHSGHSVYDPTCGSGGMLIISREYVEQSGGDTSNLRLAGQVNDASAWAICKINMLLHGVADADVQLQDTLLHPKHLEQGAMERFDRVIANPPFSQNYTTSDMEFKERFRWGWCPTTGKKADLMFAQHMLSACKPNGMVATVMPHGVLFRGGAEKEIRRKWLQEDLIEAIISLPQNLFYGAGIPACILIMRPNLSGSARNPNKPTDRQGRILFINADVEYQAGRAQNYLRPEHVEKIASTFELGKDILGYARSVPIAEIATDDNDWNLNIRRYVDNSPPAEPHDVRAHLQGGVPVTELEGQSELFQAMGFNTAHAFNARTGDDVYVDFSQVFADRTAIRALIENDSGVLSKTMALRDALATWWAGATPRLSELPIERQLNTGRRVLLESFVDALVPLRTLDRFKLAGIIATWWAETLPDLKTMLENGFGGVIDGWVDTIADAIEDDEDAGPFFDPFGHKIVRRMMVNYLDQIARARSDVARLMGEKEAFEASNVPDDFEEEQLENWNYAKDLDRQARQLKAEHKETIKAFKKLVAAAQRPRASEDVKRAAAKADAPLQSVLDQLAALEEVLAPYAAITTYLVAARDHYRDLTNAFINELRTRCNALTTDEQRVLVMELFGRDLQAGLDAAFEEKRKSLIRLMEGLWDKYRVTLISLRNNRVSIEQSLNSVLKVMRYGQLHDLLTRGIDDNGGVRDPSRNPELFKDSALGRIPLSWQVTALADTAASEDGSFVDGDWIELPHIRTEGIRLVQTGNIGVGEFIDKPGTRRFISTESFQLLRCKPLRAGDVLICRLADPVGRACLLPSSVGEAITSVDVTIYRPKQACVSAEWVACWLNTPPSLTRCDLVSGGTTRKRVSRGNLGKILIAVPPLMEQKRIIGALKCASDAIGIATNELDKLLMLKIGLMSDLLNGRVRVSEELKIEASA